MVARVGVSQLCLGIALILAGGCAQSRTVRISAIPGDAMIRVDDRDRGRGPITETFPFSGAVRVHHVSAEREGYKTQSVPITPDFSREFLVISLTPAGRAMTFSVSPMPGILKLDGQPISPTPVTEFKTEVEFHAEGNGQWSTHKVTAEHEGFEPVEKMLRYEDVEQVIRLDLKPKTKDLQIVTSPPDAEVSIDGKVEGRTPLTLTARPFPIDPATDTFAPHKLVIKKPGYEEIKQDISWDDGKIDYGPFKLEPQTKVVRIFTEPPDAKVTLGKIDIPFDAASGAHVYGSPIRFGPIDDQGNLATYSGTVSKAKTEDSQWEELPIRVEWDDGKTDYRFKLKEILTRHVPMLRYRIDRGDRGWQIIADRADTVASKDVGDAPGVGKAVRVTQLAKRAMLDTVSISPDGSHLLITTLSQDSGELKSQILVQKLGADGPDGSPRAMTDGRSLEVTPAYTADGSQVVFASNRAGRKLNIWSMATSDQPVPEQLTAGDSQDLWPSVDSNPQPRLFYQSLIDTRPDPRLFSTALGGNTRKDLSGVGGAQPRVSPTADAVLFTVANEKTRKRDIFRMSDAGKDPVNLTNTPDVDEFDAAWSGDGQRIAFVSDRNSSTEAPDNCDVYTMDAAPGGGAKPVQITHNMGWDDSPSWDVGGKAIYLRSNRGGQWNAWRIELK
jgi:hypothetical protein